MGAGSRSLMLGPKLPAAGNHAFYISKMSPGRNFSQSLSGNCRRKALANTSQVAEAIVPGTVMGFTTSISWEKLAEFIYPKFFI